MYWIIAILLLLIIIYQNYKLNKYYKYLKLRKNETLKQDWINSLTSEVKNLYELSNDFKFVQTRESILKKLEIDNTNAVSVDDRKYKISKMEYPEFFILESFKKFPKRILGYDIVWVD